MIDGGIIIEDIAEGNGTIVKRNSVVRIRYSVSNVSNKNCTGSSEIEITLGKRNSIVCWNKGIPGMKVGGVRNITSPPAHAYGSKGIPPFINGKEDVLFVIELLNCN